MASSASLAPLMRPAKVGQEVFLGVNWGGFAIGAVFFASRIYVRVISFRRLFWDDALVLLALLMFFISTVLWQVYANYLYENLAVSSGQLFPPPPDFADHVETYLRATVPIIIFFYSSLWMIKFSFLILFRRLGSKVKGQKIHWWVVTVITVASWLASFGTLEYPCLLPTDFLFLEANCTVGYAANFQRQTLLYNMLMDVITDILIMTIPISLLWKVKISLRQKVALMSIFSLTVLIMIFAIVRVAVVISYSSDPDETWLYMWSAVEQTVSIMIACLASFRVLFTKHDRPGQGDGPTYPTGSSSRRGLLRTIGFRTWLSTKEKLPDSESSKHETFGRKRSNTAFTGETVPSESEEHIIPLHSIRVQRDFDATYSSRGANHGQTQL